MLETSNELDMIDVEHTKGENKFFHLLNDNFFPGQNHLPFFHDLITL